MALAAGLLGGRIQIHRMDGGNLPRFLIPRPGDHTGLRTPYGPYSLQVAGFATDGHVGIVRYLFRMGWMTSAAIADPLFVVSEVYALRMAYCAGHFCMWGGFILLGPDEGKPCTGKSWGLSASLSMAMKADSLHPLGIIDGSSAMAGHARLILLRERR